MTFKRCAILTLSSVLTFGLTEGAHAVQAGGMITTSQVVSDMSRSADQEKVNAFMSRKDVQDQLVRFGVEPAEASQRLASLSDAELRKMAGAIDRAPAGGEVVIISLTTILLVVLILILLGKL